MEFYYYICIIYIILDCMTKITHKFSPIIKTPYYKGKIINLPSTLSVYITYKIKYARLYKSILYYIIRGHLIQQK